MVANNSKRYSESDLREFKALIEKKLDKAERQLSFMDEQLTEAAETKDSQGDWMDDSSSSSDIEMLQAMANRQKKHMLDLQNALQRVHNKSYGICIVTGELIDKRRLMAVLTTTKSLAAKLAVNLPEEKKPIVVVKPAMPAKPVIISRVISKTSTKPAVTPKPREDWDDDDDDIDDLEGIDDIDDLEGIDDMEIDNGDIDLDSFSDEDVDD